ncbi:MAG: hypothetical protein H6710_05840 [Myxococcales bacterium]|nr:hypothetical protein [Myxococcales bacterium]
MFRPTLLAAVLAEGLASKARNILGASLEIARHPTAPIALARINGALIGDDPAEFWRENADLAIYASQVLPRQCFIYYVRSGPERREGFIVAQRGQVLVAHDATPDSIPAGTPDDQWPVSRLCQQMQLSLADIADAFPGGPRVSISLAEPTGDDQQLLMILAGQPDGEAEEDFDEPPPPRGAPAPAQARGREQAPPREPARGARAPEAAAGGRAPTSKRPTVSIDEDNKRRSAQRAAEEQAMAARSAAVRSGLHHVLDERGLVVAPKAELGETEILRKYMISAVENGLPEGVPEELRAELVGKAIDFAVPVEFLSEVFVNNKPLSRPDFEANASARDLDGEAVQVMEVFAPRLGAGTLIRRGRSNVFISRRPDEPLPASLILELLG